MWKYLLLRGGVTFLSRLPHFLGYALATIIGDTTFLLAGKSRAILTANLSRVLGSDASTQTMRRTCQQCFRNLWRNYYDLVRAPRISPASHAGITEMVGSEHLDRALQYGRGVIVATAHMGNFEMLPHIALARGIPIVILVEKFEPEILWQYWMNVRNAKGVSFQAADATGIRAAFRVLKHGGIVAIACDRLVQGEGTPALFMGERAIMPIGAIDLSLRTGAVILPAFASRTGVARCMVRVEEPILLPASADKFDLETRQQVLERIIAVMECNIREKPEQWLMFQPLWQKSSAVFQDDLMLASAAPGTAQRD